MSDKNEKVLAFEPDTAYIRGAYVAWHEPGDTRFCGEEFDRWLADYTRDIRNATLEEAAQVAEGWRSWNYDDPSDWTESAAAGNETADAIARTLRSSKEAS